MTVIDNNADEDDSLSLESSTIKVVVETEGPSLLETAASAEDEPAVVVVEHVGNSTTSKQLHDV